MSTVSFLAQLDSGIVCLWNAYEMSAYEMSAYGMTYDLNGFKTRINSNLLTVASF